jgi:hypothetical protein
MRRVNPTEVRASSQPGSIVSVARARTIGSRAGGSFRLPAGGAAHAGVDEDGYRQHRKRGAAVGLARSITHRPAGALD